MSSVTETSFYGRKARLVSWSCSAASTSSPDILYDTTTFIATAIERGVDFVQVGRLPGLKPLGEGATACIAQSIINLESSFALKHIQFPDLDDASEADVIRFATIELLVMTHPEVKEHFNILALEGVAWDFSDSSRPIRPILMTEKSALGDLCTFFSKLGNDVTPENRVEICADIINAVACLHANGIIHGDIKPENILMFRKANGEFYAKLCDFGFSILIPDENENSTIDLPKSTPWHAPELNENRHGLSILEAKKTDIYSAGLVCLWLLLGNGTAQRANPWAGGYEIIERLKREKTISDFIALNLQEMLDIDEEMKSHLGIFFHLTTSEKVEERIPTMAKFIESPPISMISPISIILPTFTIRQAFGELMQQNFLIRKQVVACLQIQANMAERHSYRLNAAFQLAICSRLGFGGPLVDNDVHDWLMLADRTSNDLEAEIESIRSRDTSKESKYNNPVLQNLLQDGFLGVDFADIPPSDHFIQEHEKEVGCSYELNSMGHILTQGEVINLQLSIADAIKGRGQYHRARIILSGLLETLNADPAYGPEHPDYLNVASKITNLLSLEGEPNQALALGTFVLSICEKIWDSTSLRLSEIRKDLAFTYAHKGLYGQAEKLLRLALEAEKAALGIVHPVYLDTLNSLGDILTMVDRNEDAIQVWLEVGESLKDALTDQHPLTISAIGNIATWLDDAGIHYAAEKLYRIEMSKVMSWAGPKHPSVATTMSNLALAIKRQDRYSEAEEYARQAYEINETVLGSENHLTLLTLNNLAQILVILERFDQAERMLSVVTTKYNESLGPYHAHTLSSQLNLAGVLQRTNRLEEAKLVQMDVIAAYNRSPCEDKSLIIRARSQLATTLHDLDNYDASIDLYRLALEAQKARVGEEHPDTWAIMVDLAAVLHADGQPETQWQEAEQLYQFAIKRYIGYYGAKHTRTLATTYWLATLRVRMGQIETGEKLLIHVYAGFKEVLGENSKWARTVWGCLNYPLE
ncbi:MAG: hypothetical protein Q9171_002023 [Xanthocarpia ochracea]